MMKPWPSSSGYTVDGFKDGEQSLSAALACDYEAVILDLNLPKLDGVAVYALLDSRIAKADVCWPNAGDLRPISVTPLRSTTQTMQRPSMQD